MVDRRLRGKLLALTREIHRRKPHEGKSFRESFFVGDLYAFPPPRIAIEWWRTRRSFDVVRDIAEIAIRTEPSCCDCQRDTIADLVLDALRQNAFNDRLFDPDQMLTSGYGSGPQVTVFDLRLSEDPEEFANRLWEVVQSTIERATARWLVLYPLARLSSRSHEWHSHHLRLLRPDDAVAWSGLAESYPEMRAWDPATASHSGRTDNPLSRVLEKNKHVTWCACEANGTAPDARVSAGYKIRTLVALLLAHGLGEDERAVLSRSMAAEVGFTLQFPAAGHQTRVGSTTAGTRPLFPAIGGDLQISDSTCARIADWLAELDRAQEETRRRIRTASQFAHFALMTSGVERYVHFFVVLDGLFGERGKTERTITEGVERVCGRGSVEVTKVGWLFELRSELVHGGCSSIPEWGRLRAYERHYTAHPMDDIAQIALRCLRSPF